MKPNSILIIDRDWASYTKGTRFVLVEQVPCGPVETTNGTINPVNLRVVIEGEAIPENHVLCRTIPAEYAVEVPAISTAMDIDANQGVRDGYVIATLGTEVLIEYEMPAGRTYGRVIDLLRPGWYRAVPMNNLPKKWRTEIAA